MKLQLNVLGETFKKSLVWLGIWLSLIILTIIFSSSYHFELSSFLSLINFPGHYNYALIEYILIIYQICLITYITYVFYTYELNNSYSNIILRVKKNKWYLTKILMIIFMNIIFSIINFLICYSFLHSFITFKFTYIIMPLIYNISCSFFLILLIELLGNNKSIIFILTLIGNILMRYYWYPWYIIILFISILLFKKKKFTYN